MQQVTIAVALLAVGAALCAWLRTGRYRREDEGGPLPHHLWVVPVAPVVGALITLALDDRPWPVLLPYLVLVLAGLALAALGLRCLFVLPCLLVTASDSFQSAWCRAEKQKPEHRDRRRLMLCLFVLLTGTVAECALVPKLFALLLPRIA